MADLQQVVNTTRGQERRITCGNCDQPTRHFVVESVNTTRVVHGYTFTHNYEIVRCNGCDRISFRHHLRIVDLKKKEEVFVDREHLYPPHVAGRRKLSDDYQLPEQVGRIYRETHQALCAQQVVLAGIGIRALIEAVCREKNTTGATLEKRIDNLVTLGVLTAAGASILHKLRTMGNVAAHEVQPHSEKDLSVAFDVVEHLLEGVYLLPKKAAQFGDTKP